MRNEAEEPDVILDAASNDSQTQILMFRKLISNDDQLQIPVALVIRQFHLQNGECLYQSMHILVRPYLSRKQNKRIFQLVAFENLSSFFRRVVVSGSFVQRVINHGNFRLRQLEDVD